MAYWISDLILDNLVFSQYYDGFQWFGSLWVYASFALIIALGVVLLKKVNFGNLLTAGISSSIIFFLITNFGVWFKGISYPQTFEGLIACYVAAIPFFWNTLAGDLFYIAVLFGAFEMVKMKYPQLVKQTI